MFSMFARNRKRFLAAMKNGVAVFPSAPVFVRNNDVDHEYRQDSDFYYLTGFEEPEAVAVLAPGHPKHGFVLFVRPRDPEREIWDGRRAGVEGARRRFGADAAYPIAQLEEKLPEYLSGGRRLYYAIGKHASFDPRLIGILNRMKGQVRAGVAPPTEIVDPSAILHEQRLRKSPEEVVRMREAARTTADGHIAAMKATRPGVWEYEIDGLLRYHFLRGGSRRVAYSPIVGSGPNTTILHYNENSRRMKKGDLLLVDAGSEHRFYACDVTRTFPVSGRFSPAQREVYEVVLEAQKAAIGECRVGVPFARYHEKAVQVLTRGMVRIGLLKGKPRELVRSQAYRRFYMHRTGHWLGMDVHDVGSYRRNGSWRPLEAGMVLTVEPGIYVAEGTRGAPRRFWNVGVRIEDDILVTPKGPEILTRDIPKEVAELEGIVGTG